MYDIGVRITEYDMYSIRYVIRLAEQLLRFELEPPKGDDALVRLAEQLLE